MIRPPELTAALKVVKAHKQARQRESKVVRLARAREHLKAAEEGQRKPRERDNGFLAYLRRQPCEARALGGCGGPSDPAHVRYSDGPGRINPGMGNRNHDRRCNPLCRNHHEMQHGMGKERAFWERIGKDAYETAARHYAAYRGLGE